MSKPVPKRPRDTNQLAKLVVGIAVGEVVVEPVGKKAAAGRVGGLKGGKARMASLDAEQKSKLAREAAAKRWKKPAPDKGAG